MPLLPSGALWRPTRVPFTLCTCDTQASSFLLKARVLGWPNLIVAHSQDVATTVCLLQELHAKDSLCCLPMETKAEVGSKFTRKLSFCPFCQYSGSNDQSYMNHIICRHSNTNSGCSKCLNEVFITGQLLHKHMKICKGLPKEAANKDTTEDRWHHLREEEKSKELPADLQPTSQSFQGGLAVELMLQPAHQEKKPPQHYRCQTPTRKRNAPPVTSTGASPAKTRMSQVNAVQPSPEGPARTNAARPAKKSPVITPKQSPVEPAKTSPTRKARTSLASTTGKARPANRSK